MKLMQLKAPYVDHPSSLRFGKSDGTLRAIANLGSVPHTVKKGSRAAFSQYMLG